MLNAYSSFDVLSVVTRMQPLVGGVLSSELHSFTYLACLLSLYAGRPAADWQYSYASTANGIPFSQDIEESSAFLRACGLLGTDGPFISVSDRGRRSYRLFASLSQNREREPFLEAACSSVLVLPVGAIHDALLNEPGLRQAVALSSSRTLLESPGLRLLYEHFNVIRKVLGPQSRDLLVPASVWLSYLSRRAASPSASQSLGGDTYDTRGS